MRDSILVSPFGQHTRYLLRSYLLHSFVVLQGVLFVALTVDVVPQLAKVLSGASAMSNLGTLKALAWFIVLRSADLMPRFIPLACFLGVLWTEIALTLSRERILIWNTGRSPLKCLVPIAFLTIAFGAAQFVFDAFLRPAAMAAQIEEHLGTYGEQFDRGLSKDQIWMSFRDNVLRARVLFAPTPALYDLTLYRLEDGRLREVDNARSAVPAPLKGYWLLDRGTFWLVPPESTAGSRDGAPEGSETYATAFESRQVALTEDALHLSVWGIYPEYLSQRTLRGLIQDATRADRALFVVRLQTNYANALMPGAMALLAATLSLMLFAYQAPRYTQLAVLPAGYAGHLAMKTFVLMGEHEYLNPVVAAWLSPVCLLALSALLLARTESRRHMAGRAHRG